MQRSTSPQIPQHARVARARSTLEVGAFVSAALLVMACGGGDESSGLPVIAAAGMGGAAETPATTVAGAPAVVPANAPSGAAAGSTGTAGATSTAGSPSMPAAVAGSAADHAHTGAGGSGAMMAMAAAQCKLQATVDPRDEMLTDAPLMMTVGAQTDLLMPQLVLDWMIETQFAEAHDAWHLVRKWDQSCRKSNATASSCTAA
jgi:hypothetical protein